jgi:hypothetical protein
MDASNWYSSFADAMRGDFAQEFDAAIKKEYRS